MAASSGGASAARSHGLHASSAGHSGVVTSRRRIASPIRPPTVAATDDAANGGTPAGGRGEGREAAPKPAAGITPREAPTAPLRCVPRPFEPAALAMAASSGGTAGGRRGRGAGGGLRGAGPLAGLKHQSVGRGRRVAHPRAGGRGDGRRAGGVGTGGRHRAARPASQARGLRVAPVRG